MTVAVLLVLAGVAAVAAGGEQPDQLHAVEVRSTRGMVVAGDPAAAAAGARILATGGNAIDAAMATAFAMGAADPASSGLGGQTLILVHLRDGRDVAIDGAIRVPLRFSRAALQERLEEGRAFGHAFVGVPGTLAALAHALGRFGTRPLAEVMAPAIEIARAGTRMMPFQWGYLEDYLPKLAADPVMAALFLRDGIERRPPGAVYCQDDLVRTLSRIAAGGPDVFYRGGIAAEIDADMAAHGGYVSRTDLAAMRAIEREPLRLHYGGVEVVTFPFPGGGGQLGEALGILEAFPFALRTGDGPDAAHLLLEAERIAMLDENGDPLGSVAGGPARNGERARQRAALIHLDGLVDPRVLGHAGPVAVWERDTTHLSVVDAAGNAVSITQSIGRSFGAAVATPGLGFAYNSALETSSYLEAGAIARLRPGSPLPTSMAPAIVMRGGRLFLVLGSVGSARVVPSMLSVLTRVVDRGQPLVAAVAAPRVLWGGPAENRVYAEVVPPVTDDMLEVLFCRGFYDIYRQRYPGVPRDVAAFGGVNAIMVDPATGELVGVADPRRDGGAAAPGE